MLFAICRFCKLPVYFINLHLNYVIGIFLIILKELFLYEGNWHFLIINGNHLSQFVFVMSLSKWYFVFY